MNEAYSKPSRERAQARLDNTAPSPATGTGRPAAEPPTLPALALPCSITV